MANCPMNCSFPSVRASRALELKSASVAPAVATAVQVLVTKRDDASCSPRLRIRKRRATGVVESTVQSTSVTPSTEPSKYVSVAISNDSPASGVQSPRILSNCNTIGLETMPGGNVGAGTGAASKQHSGVRMRLRKRKDPLYVTPNNLRMVGADAGARVTGTGTSAGGSVPVPQPHDAEMADRRILQANGL